MTLKGLFHLAILSILDIYIPYMHSKPMQFIWDPAKAKANLKKHCILFSCAEAVFFLPVALTIGEQHVDGERRFVTPGSDATGQVLVVVYTYRGETVRFISAKKGTPSKRKDYEKEI